MVEIFHNYLLCTYICILICRLCLGDSSLRQFNYRQCCDVRPNTHVRIRGLRYNHCHNWEGRICSTVLHAPAIVDGVVTSDLIRMCVFGSTLYHYHNWRGRFVSLCRMHRPCRVIRPDYAICAQFLFMGRYYSLSKTNLCLYVIK